MGYSNTISLQIQNGKAIDICDASYRLQTLVDLGEDYLLINTESVLSKYRDLIMKYASKYKLGGEDALKYMYRPTFLSYRVYRTIEMAPFILQANHMVSASEFTNLEKGIYLFNGQISNVLNEILNKEEHDIQLNREEIDAELAKL